MPSVGAARIPATVVNTLITSQKDARAISFQTVHKENNHDSP
jgi:hypothetical protein